MHAGTPACLGFPRVIAPIFLPRYPLLFACSNRSFLLSLREQIVYFFVRELREVLVPVANSVERLWCLSADDLVYLCAQFLAGRRSRYRHCNNQTSGELLSQCCCGSKHVLTGRETVIDENNDTPVHIGR